MIKNSKLNWNLIQKTNTMKACENKAGDSFFFIYLFINFVCMCVIFGMF